MSQKEYIPAMKFHWLTPIYDPLLKRGMKEAKFKSHLIHQADLRPGQRVLDLACGTGTLTLMIKQAQLEAEIIGLDADPEVLAIAKTKAEQNQLDISFQKGMSLDLPFPDAHLDHIFSSLFFHHLTLEMKRKTLEELLRTLRPGGQINIIDFEKPHNLWMRIAFLPIQLLDGFETTKDHAKGILPQLFRQSGFEEVQQTGQFATIFGTLRSYRAQKPA
ncbi:class I SAM-dependent methyltransferase [Paenibacillus apiarius]|uniref:Class I SAM-dependent methyltransferase n=1 Tax=Paenibacillus apiarius TaxID=46240 RepID=A0ABT4DZA3_9BACL|nr:class I SAM-dependent methyltransferase [Paenibacillus apiarius]MCY9514809.1 class I SAM-dependent methyltransferase [Paenibacillus apiarius]MCY9521311.1 class I SAM-dependent methyltransferase [Paenibacillus apiarius]MCY9554027.1 class I SAM-dependent methyltransferase [Paenibacillus apiarius]MCY9560401.1 class I SAM-dependent methyltransferase [Paenibacillus apiarius]MCY9682261.1 class I SAM-dependent methyltransferase [Paenibacillus apiarius]